MSLDRAIEAAAEAFLQYNQDNPGQEWGDFGPTVAARIAVEAAAPHITQEYNKRNGWEDANLWQRRAQENRERAERAEKAAENLDRSRNRCQYRAERAEAEVERMSFELGQQRMVAVNERALADQLAEALSVVYNQYCEGIAYMPADIALAAWEEARRG